ncbi:hypothetical protein BaRGS_00000595 [Batillaria attramentaria]|uniref:Uncharacterized protein n=1 Tax=Batillaria attramentaria TaxID=370345 RepID=A0ABD0MAG6_9CAEN
MTSHSESFCRDRRLYDVRRGVVYLRRTDDLAQRQWRHYGAVPAIKTHVIRDIGVTTVLPDLSMSQSDVTLDDSRTELRGTESRATTAEETEGVRKHEDVHLNVPTQDKSSGPLRPTISLTTVSRNERILSPGPILPKLSPIPSVNTSVTVQSPHQVDSSKSPSPVSAVSTGTAGGQLRALLFSSRDGQAQASSPPFSMSTEERHVLRESHSLAAGHVTGGAFNTWGSRDWEPSADKVEPLQPRNYAPKHYPPMSRVVGAGRKGAGKRQLRTLTDFRSRNGTIRVIRPPGPIIETRRTQGTQGVDVDDEAFDVEALDREKTYAMLKRIDRLLEPSRAYFTSDLASSQREVTLSSSSTPTTPSLTDTLPKGDHVYSHRDPDTGQSYRDLGLNPRATYKPRRRHSPPVQQPNSREGQHKRGKRDPHHGHGPTVNLQARARDPTSQASLATVVRRLESKGMDLHQKCQDWIRRNFPASGTMTQRGS